MKKIDTEKAFSKKSSIYSDDNNVVFRSNNDRVIIAISEYPNGKRREFGIEIYDERMEKYVKYEMSYGQMIDMISEIQNRINLGNKEYNVECGKQRIPHRCPVCDGIGFVPSGFYSPCGTTSFSAEQCKTCNGSGVVWG